MSYLLCQTPEGRRDNVREQFPDLEELGVRPEAEN